MNTNLKLKDMPMNNFIQQGNKQNDVNVDFLMKKFQMMNQGKKFNGDNSNSIQNNLNSNQINQGNNNINSNNNFNQNQNNQQMQFNQVNSNNNFNNFNNFNQNQNIIQKSNQIYFNLKQKNFSSPPNFINSLTKETANISPQNRSTRKMSNMFLRIL